MVATLGLTLVVISLGGVANTVLLETHRRTRELALLKALGLEPRGVIATVAWSVIPAGLLAGVAGVPLGLAASRAVLVYIADIAANLRIPERSFDVLPVPLLAALAASGLILAVVGAAGPALRRTIADRTRAPDGVAIVDGTCPTRASPAASRRGPSRTGGRRRRPAPA